MSRPSGGLMIKSAGVPHTAAVVNALGDVAEVVIVVRNLYRPLSACNWAAMKKAIAVIPDERPLRVRWGKYGQDTIVKAEAEGMVTR